jgi:hypothetical protein
MFDLVILFSPMRAQGWRAFVIKHPPGMDLGGFDEHGAAFGLPEPDLRDLARRLASSPNAPKFRLRGASNGGARVSFAASHVPTVRAWLDELFATNVKRAG